MHDELDGKTSALMLAGILCLTVVVIANFAVDSVQRKYEQQAAAIAAVAANARAQAERAPKEFPTVALEGRTNHEEAIAKLADRLPEVAAWYGFSPTELQEMFRKDKTLWVDEQARLFYAEEVPQGIVSAVVSSTSLGAQYPLEDTFKLHSRPTAKRVIYLDFDGATLTGTAWNSYVNMSTINAPAFDMDGAPGTFSNTERERIQQIWQRVSEDYAPFNIDVTTEAPSADRLVKTSTSDEYYGTTALITPAASIFGNYGGIAYVGVFGNISMQPALIFSDALGNDGKNIGEAASHEIGHNTGLSHDGTSSSGYYYGHGSWAPIMGVGYSQAVVQFSRGDYAGANNTQDDVAIIEALAGGPLPDDCAGTVSTSCTLTQGVGTVSGAGVIERKADTDMFAFQADAGAVSVEVGMHPYASNLNARMTLLDGSGNVIATAPDSTVKGVLNATVPGGTYYVSVQGVGATDYPDYGSLGNYQIRGTVVYSGKLPPVAAASASPLSGSAPLVVQFSSDGSADPDGLIASYTWDFGDGTKATEADPQKTYTANGTYTATLTVTDSDGATDSDSVQISVNNAAPSAVAEATPKTGNAPLSVGFSGSKSSDSDGTIASYAWNFGDGTTGTGATVSHDYTKAGTYTAVLTVTDNGGKSATANVSVSVTDPNVVVAPSGLTATAAGGTVTLTWNDNASNETEYRIYRWREVRRTAANYQQVGTTAANSTTYKDTVTSGTYLYYVAAVNTTTGVSAASAPIKIRVR